MTILEARDILFALVKANFPNYIVWDDLPAERAEGTWARASVIHLTGGQVSLAGETGTRRFSRSGVVKVQIFAPVGSGMVEGYSLAQALLIGFELFRGEVWLRNIRLNEAGTNGAFTSNKCSGGLLL